MLDNVWFVVKWLDEYGVVEGAKYLKSEYLTGTAITIILVLLFLLVKPGKNIVGNSGLIRRCPVCDHLLTDGKGKVLCGVRE